MLYCLFIASSFGVDSLHRQGCHNKIIHILADVQLVGFRDVSLFEFGPDWELKVFQTSVAGDSHRAFHLAGNVYRSSSISQSYKYLHVRIEDFGILKFSKEPGIRLPLEVGDSGCQIIDFNNKGLQR